MHSAVLEAQSVSVRFGDRLALDQVSFTLAPGEMTALVGPSGSGKSTLLRAFAGLTPIADDGGRIVALGERLQDQGRISPDARRLRARIGFVFQKFNLVGRLSLYSNVMIGRLGRTPFWRGLLGLWDKHEAALGHAALDRMGLHEQTRQRASTLSGGQQQRGALARALVQEAEVILADEPVASLDPASAHRVMDALAKVNAEDGVSVLVSLHQIDLALAYCSRIVALSEGRIVFDGPASSLEASALHAIYGEEYADAAPARSAVKP